MIQNMVRYFVMAFCATKMSWLEWVASNAYEGGVIDSMASTRATFAKLSVFGIFANFTFLNIVPGQTAYFLVIGCARPPD